MIRHSYIGPTLFVSTTSNDGGSSGNNDYDTKWVFKVEYTITHDLF